MSDQTDEILLEAEDKMDKAIAVAREDFATVRTGRATPSIFNKIVVDYYGTFTPIQQLASFQSPEARMIIVSPYDKGASAAIEKAIRDSDLGVNPTSDGTVIREKGQSSVDHMKRMPAAIQLGFIKALATMIDHGFLHISAMDDRSFACHNVCHCVDMTWCRSTKKKITYSAQDKF
jgi:hypothetical protein